MLIDPDTGQVRFVIPEVGGFLFELAIPKQGLEQLFYLFGIVPARFTHPDWASYVGFPVDGYWTILAYQFLHGGWLHIIANMWTLWIFGDTRNS